MGNIIALASLAIFAASAAGAQTLASADNTSVTAFTQDRNAPWSLDGAGTTTLTFQTSKANTAVQLGFSGFCGANQSAPDGSQGALTSGVVQIFFEIDGNIIGEAGFANVLCSWLDTPLNSGTVVGSGVTTQQKVTIATPGKHTIAVVLQSQHANNGSNLVPYFGQSHVTVSK